MCAFYVKCTHDLYCNTVQQGIMKDLFEKSDGCLGKKLFKKLKDTLRCDKR